jgi:hypothetical protein
MMRLLGLQTEGGSTGLLTYGCSAAVPKNSFLGLRSDVYFFVYVITNLYASVLVLGTTEPHT